LLAMRRWTVIFSLWVAILFPSNTLAKPQANALWKTNCSPFSIASSVNGLPEIHGQSDNQTVWALLFPYHLPVWSNEDLKIVWRMTGSGLFNLQAQNSNGRVIMPIWGPEAHGGSSWDRPGYEWGTGFNFPEGGCWHIVVTRGNDNGSIDLWVIDRRAIETF